MMANSLLLLFFICPLAAAAQQDSITYYNGFWKKTAKDSAEYFRLWERKGNFFHAKDYYISGKLQMEGDYSSQEPEIEEGYFIWYYENGQKFAEGNYVHGQRDGIWTFWFPDGLRKEEMLFHPGKEEEYELRWQSKRQKNSRPLVNRAIEKKENGHLKDAEKLLNAAIEINPFCDDALYERGLLKCETGQTESGCEDLKKAREFGYYDMLSVAAALETYCK